jgi:hypothetical protein
VERDEPWQQLAHTITTLKKVKFAEATGKNCKAAQASDVS